MLTAVDKEELEELKHMLDSDVNVTDLLLTKILEILMHISNKE